MLIIGARLAHLSASIHPAVVVSGVAEDHEILVTIRGGAFKIPGLMFTTTRSGRTVADGPLPNYS